MSMAWQEAAYEEAMEALYAEHKEQAIEEFIDDWEAGILKFNLSL